MLMTISLNPCLDRSVWADGIQEGCLNRVAPIRTDAGGKGINAAVAAVQLGGRAFCVGFNFEEDAVRLVRTLEEAGVEYDMLMLPGALRVSFKMFDARTGAYTEINESGGEVDEEDVAALRVRIRAHLPKCGLVLLGGSVPPGVSNEVYANIIRDARSAGCRTVLDASGVLLKKGLEERPSLIKPNLEELGELFGHSYSQDDEAVMRDAKELLAHGIGAVCVSMGERGALLACREGVWRAPAVPVQAKGLQGAGDSMVAALGLGMERGRSPEELLRSAVAAATASVILEGTQLCRREDYEAFYEQVQAERIG